MTRALVPLASVAHRARTERLDADLLLLGACIDAADQFVAEGVLGGDVPNVADFQFAPNIVALGEITGRFTTEDLLGRIFSSFCIGK